MNFTRLFIRQGSPESPYPRKCLSHVFGPLECHAQRESEREAQPRLQVLGARYERPRPEEVLVRHLGLDKETGSTAEESISGEASQTEVKRGGSGVEPGLEMAGDEAPVIVPGQVEPVSEDPQDKPLDLTTPEILPKTKARAPSGDLHTVLFCVHSDPAELYGRCSTHGLFKSNRTDSKREPQGLDVDKVLWHLT